MLWRENQHLRGSTIPGTTQLTDTARLSVPITTHEPMTSGLPINLEQSRSLPTSRLPVTNLANFPEDRFWTGSPTIGQSMFKQGSREQTRRVL